MNMETKIHATVRMYLQAYEQRFDNPELLQKWAKRVEIPVTPEMVSRCLMMADRYQCPNDK